MHELTERLLRSIRKQGFLRPGDRLAVAVSGGADSVALLLLLIDLQTELGIALSVAHVNHKLRGAESDEDERFVAELATAHELEIHAIVAPINRDRMASDTTGNPTQADSGKTSNVEAIAREQRYSFFRDLARQGRVAKIATAHTLDDQAETVLLRMFRGTGIRGLAGIHPRLVLGRIDGNKKVAERNDQGDVSAKTDESATGEVIRPLLGFRRAELRDYLRARGQIWREDSSNDDIAFLRNRVRQRLIPLIAQEFGDAAIEHLAELAEIARAEEEWASTQSSISVTQAQDSFGTKFVSAFASSTPTAATLNVDQLQAVPLAAARRLARDWIEANAFGASISFRLIEEILELARGPAGRKLELPCGSSNVNTKNANTKNANAKATRQAVRRGRKELFLEPTSDGSSGDYEYLLMIPVEILIPEIGVRIELRLVNAEDFSEQEREQLLDPAHVGAKVVIRNWRAGDRYWPAHTASEKKVKELLSDRHATGTDKKLWPVMVAENGALVWMRGFAVPASVRATSGKAIAVREMIAGSSDSQAYET